VIASNRTVAGRSLATLDANGLALGPADSLVVTTGYVRLDPLDAVDTFPEREQYRSACVCMRIEHGEHDHTSKSTDRSEGSTKECVQCNHCVHSIYIYRQSLTFFDSGVRTHCWTHFAGPENVSRRHA
jgi:hypothetical protein